jgi:ABC-type sugar transport system ATPase subunit
MKSSSGAGDGNSPAPVAARQPESQAGSDADRSVSTTAALSVAHLAKAFGPTQALRSCTFELRPGEVHAIVGENGSGKSTFVKILTGVHQPDRGTLQIGDGAPVARLLSPRAAMDAGIVAVFQEVLVVPAQTVLDNVWLGSDGIFKRALPKRERRAVAHEMLSELLGTAPDLDAPVETLSLRDMQACGIARALVRRPRILILDEATSALDISTRDNLFAIARRLTADGGSIIFISHRMDEISDFADRVTVMRSGETVATLERANVSTPTLVRLMSGSHSDSLIEVAAPVTATGRGAASDVVLRAVGLRLANGAAPMDVDIRAGELVGLAGLEGHGQEDFLLALCGEGTAIGEVVRVHGDRSVAVTSRLAAAKQKIAYVPRDRRADSLFSPLSILENFAIVTQRSDVRGGLLRSKRTRERFSDYVERLRIVANDGAAVITTLSGGNQQKVVLARWLADSPMILLLNDPTRGIDINAKRDLYALLVSLAADGLCVVMLSTELDEHVELMDRVLVFREHELAVELNRDDLSREALVAAFFGE